MNNHNYYADSMAQLVSSRRGSNYRLHNLGENDVVFGTKGNGRNEVFLKVLEKHSEQYMQLSKFEKMGLIQHIIREWKGNFYILNSQTNGLCLAKKKDNELSTTDQSSKKLYTSVRRMMNYVNSKNLRQHQQPSQYETLNEAPTTVRIKTETTTAVTVPQVRKERIKKENKMNTVSTTSFNLVQNDHILTTAPTIYIKHDHGASFPHSNAGFLSSSSNNMIISAPQRLVTPEPSPRTMFVPPPPTLSLSLFAKPMANPTISIPSQDTSVAAPSSLSSSSFITTRK